MNKLQDLMKPLSFDFTIDVINPEVLDIIYGSNIDIPPMCDIEYEYLKQVRKHKKKRINKKWAKRYGMIQVTKVSKGWRVITKTDGSVEFVKEGDRL